MKIRILRLLDGARQAEGLTVVIDVFRAFTTACYMVDRGARFIITVGDIDRAYRMKRENPEYLLAGERGGVTQPGFDYGNSPAQIEHADLSGKTIILTTSAGTQGIEGAKKASRILTGSFANARATADYIRERHPPVVSLVCMGLEAREKADEDEFCAEYIRSLLEGAPFDFDRIIPILRAGSGSRFFDPARLAWSPPGDFELCLARDRFPFVLVAEPGGDGLARLRKVAV